MSTELRAKFSQDLISMSAVEQRIEEIKTQQANLAAEKAALEQVRLNQRDKILKAMQSKGITNISLWSSLTGERIRFRTQQSPGKVTLKAGVKLEDVPDEFKRVTVELDKVAIKTALKKRPLRAGTVIDAQVAIAALVDVVREEILQIKVEEPEDGPETIPESEDVGVTGDPGPE